MFNKAKIAELENKLYAGRKELEKALKDKTDLEERLKSAKEKISGLESNLEEARGKIGGLESSLDEAKGKIGELDSKLKDTDLEALKDKAKQSIVEFEGLKELYSGKIRELDESRESQEEEFARESAVKRHNLAEEIRVNREENQERVSNTVQAFAGSYLYYMDQIRMMMDALSQAATETGQTLFSGSLEEVKERFGASIAGHLRNDVGALAQGTGDRLLIGAAEKDEPTAAPAEPAPVEEAPAEEAPAEEAPAEENAEPAGFEPEPFAVKEPEDQ